MIEEVNRQSTMMWMYVIVVLIVIMIVGAYEITMSTPIGLTQASIDANFASKAILKGGITHTAAIVAMPKLAGINKYTVEYGTFPGGIVVGNDTREYRYRVKIDGLGLTEDSGTMYFPYAIPLDTFAPSIGTIRSGTVKVIYFGNAYDTHSYPVAAIRSLSPGFRGPFNQIIDFEHVI
ncbi:MAG: hypothetical protein Q7J10_05650 [Methanosarcinaceae archaeon]|nr:hypothetical protein [Methanosarcinaceae archaeon]